MAEKVLVQFTSKDQLQYLKPNDQIYIKHSSELIPEMVYIGNNRFSYLFSLDQMEVFTEKFFKDLKKSKIKLYIFTPPNSLKFIQND